MFFFVSPNLRHIGSAGNILMPKFLVSIAAKVVCGVLHAVCWHSLWHEPFADLGLCDRSGDTREFAPEFTGNVGGEYFIAVGDAMEAVVGTGHTLLCTFLLFGEKNGDQVYNVGQFPGT